MGKVVVILAWGNFDNADFYTRAIYPHPYKLDWRKYTLKNLIIISGLKIGYFDI